MPPPPASTVSIALATWQGAAYLGEQLRSVLAQDRLPDELVVSDDASTDETLAIVEAFRVAAPFPVHVLTSTHRRGYVANFSKAIAETRGELVLLCDQDDVWQPQKIRRMVEAFAEQPAMQLLVHDALVVDERLQWHGDSFSRRLRDDGQSPCGWLGMAMGVRGRFARACCPVPPTWPQGHDDWLAACALALEARARLGGDALALYRRHARAASSIPLHVTQGQRDRWSSSVRQLIDSATTVIGHSEAPLINWLESKARVLVSTGVSDAASLQRAVARLRQQEAQRLHRLALLQLPRRHRWREVLRLWRRGGYDAFSGWRSAVKDFTLSPR
jgi:glycosyltransferase involved in cell wall biosynthesis